MKDKAFQFPVPKPRAVAVGTSPLKIYQDTPKETGGKPSYENNMLWALLQAGWKMEQIGYQVPVAGGRSSRGGLVIDFVLYTPAPIPIQVGATWWHKDSGEETLEDARIARVYGRLPLRCFDTDNDTREHTLAWVLRMIGHA